MKKILAIDGGGIKGVFPASFLATLENGVGESIAGYFDLIVGTSTGGIIALGLGLGHSASEILRFYEEHGPSIFSGNRLSKLLRHVGLTKYDSRTLKAALESVFDDQALGQSNTRLVIPSCNLDTGEVHVWKTAHHPRLEVDYKARAVDVALSTAAAPSYFIPHRLPGGSPLVDGGMWANNPVAVGVVEAIGVLGWDPDSLRVLSLGCTSSPVDIRAGQAYPLGWVYWGAKVIDVFMAAQASAATGMALHLIGRREDLIRINPSVPNRFALDRPSGIPSLKGLGEAEARKALPALRETFFASKAERFEPAHVLTGR